MTVFLLIAIFVASALSLGSYVYCWTDIKRGRPHIISLRQITTVMDREKISRRFGRHDAAYRYHLPPDGLRALLKERGFFFYGECAADALCMLGAYWYLTQGAAAPMTPWFIVLGGTCQSINFVYSMHVVRKWAHQIREEIENSRD